MATNVGAVSAPGRAPLSDPLLVHDRFLTGKVGQGSEAAEIVDQQLALLGTQLVTQLNVLLKLVRTHGVSNSALERPVASIRTLARTLSTEEPVALRAQEGFIFLGERHLRTSPQQLLVFSSFFELLAALGIGGVELSGGIGSDELRRFAELFAATEPGEQAVHGLRSRLTAAGVENLRLELPRYTEKQERPDGSVRAPRTAADRRARVKAHAGSAYQSATNAAGELNQSARGPTGSLRFRQARRAIQNIADLLLKDPATVLGLTTLRAHDEYTQNHSVNVALLGMALANRAGFGKAALADLGMAALFHDLGKCSMPLEVLNKPGEFTPGEWELMRTHPSEGVVALVSQRGIDQVPMRMAAAAFEHHLNFDCSGYPKLAQPWRQTLSSRIISIADCYDAMTSARVYRRQPLPPSSVLAFLVERSGTLFDPALVKQFVTCIGIVPIGTLALLDTGELAVVLRPPLERENAERPTVKVIAGADGAPLEPAPEADLTEIDEEGRYLRSIVRLVDNTEYRLDTSRYVMGQ